MVDSKLVIFDENRNSQADRNSGIYTSEQLTSLTTIPTGIKGLELAPQKKKKIVERNYNAPLLSHCLSREYRFFSSEVPLIKTPTKYFLIHEEKQHP